MIVLIGTIILGISFLGMIWILFQKIPVLIQLSERPEGESFIWKLKKKSQNIFVKKFSYEIFLQKILSKIKILTLKTENKTSDLLQKLREKYERRKEDDNYWDDIKKATKDR